MFRDGRSERVSSRWYACYPRANATKFDCSPGHVAARAFYGTGIQDDVAIRAGAKVRGSRSPRSARSAYCRTGRGRIGVLGSAEQALIDHNPGRPRRVGQVELAAIDMCFNAGCATRGVYGRLERRQRAGVSLVQRVDNRVVDSEFIGQRVVCPGVAQRKPTDVDPAISGDNHGAGYTVKRRLVDHRASVDNAATRVGASRLNLKPSVSVEQVKKYVEPGLTCRRLSRPT